MVKINLGKLFSSDHSLAFGGGFLPLVVEDEQLLQPPDYPSTQKHIPELRPVSSDRILLYSLAIPDILPILGVGNLTPTKHTHTHTCQMAK